MKLFLFSYVEHKLEEIMQNIKLLKETKILFLLN